MFVRQRQGLWFVVMVVLLVLLTQPTLQAQEQDNTVIAIQVNGHSFDLPQSIADGFAAFVIDEPTAYPDNGDAIQPPRTEFRLQMFSETIPSPPAVAWVNVYMLDVLKEYAEYEQYEQLADLLNNRPELSSVETLPTLYFYQRTVFAPEDYTEFFINAAYLDSADYRGITFIYGRAVQINNSQPVLFYRLYFEGISLDNQRYLSAQIEGQQGFIEPLEGITDVDEFVAEVKAMFQNPTDEAVIAWLRQADVMFSSFDYTDQP